MKDNVLGFLGILFRANKVLVGEAARLTNIGKMGFLAIDASETTKKEIHNLAKKLNIPLYECYSKEELGDALGYTEISFLVITDKKAAQSIEKKRKEIE